MLTRVTILTAAMALLTVSPMVSAHERFRVVGTVTKRTADEFEVKTKEDKKITIGLDNKTVVTREKKKVPASSVKVGASVVVDALGDDETELVAEEVRLVPAIPRTPKP
jgi:hypothetical protein